MSAQLPNHLENLKTEKEPTSSIAASYKRTIWVYLDRLATIGIIVILIIIGVSIWRNHTGVRVGSTPLAIKVGEILAEIPKWDYAAHEQSLIVFASTSCRFCNASMDFYKRIAVSPVKDSFLLAYPDKKESVSAYLSDKNFSGQVLPEITLNKYNVTSFPTLVLVDQRGKIKQVWVGMLQSQQEHDVFKQLGID